MNYFKQKKFDQLKERLKNPPSPIIARAELRVNGIVHCLPDTVCFEDYTHHLYTQDKDLVTGRWNDYQIRLSFSRGFKK